METNDEAIQMRKRNMKLFPIYKMLGWDYLFFYAIDFLFLTQVKNMSPSDVVIKSTFYALFGLILQIPANITIEYLGRKNSLVVANIFNCIFMLIFMMSRTLTDLIFAEFFAAMAFAIKNIVETNILAESIPPARNKSKIFSKINARGVSSYYILNSLSKIIAGILFKVNGYIPIIISAVVLVIVTILSMLFIEPIEKKRSKKIDLGGKEIKEIREGFRFVLKSERLKALILSCAMIRSLLAIMTNYSTSILNDIGLSSTFIGMIAAVIGIISATASKKQNEFHNIFRNKSLLIVSLVLSISCLICGLCGLGAEKSVVLQLILLASLLAYGFSDGLYYTLSDRYLGNFSNKHIDTKIYTVHSFSSYLSRVIRRFFSSIFIR